MSPQIGLTGVFALTLGAAARDVTGCEDSTASQFLGQVKPVLYVRNLATSQKFYTEVLGFEFLYLAGDPDDPYYAEMKAGSLKFGLHVPGSERERDRVGHERLYFRVKSATDHRARVLACGGKPSDMIETDWMTMFSVMDPDGHEITFAETDPAKHSLDPW